MQTIKLIGFYAIIAAALTIEILLIDYTPKEPLLIPISMGVVIITLFSLAEYHKEFLAQEIEEYRIVRVHDIRETKEINVKFYVEQKYFDLLRNKEEWCKILFRITEEDACQVITNLKQGIPLTENNIEKVIDRQC